MSFQIRSYIRPFLYKDEEGLSFRIKVYLWAVAISLIAFFAYNILQDVFGGEEARIRKFIMTGKARIEKKSILGLSDMVSFDYKDKYGNDRATLVYGAKNFVSYYKDVFINIEGMDIRLNETKTEADVEFTALIIGRTRQAASETIGQGLEGEKDKFRLKLIKEEDGWKLLDLEFLQPINVMGETIGFAVPRGSLPTSCGCVSYRDCFAGLPSS